MAGPHGESSPAGGEPGRTGLLSCFGRKSLATSKPPRSLEVAYNQIQDALNENPDLTFSQIIR